MIEESLLNVPGFVNEMVEFTQQTAPRQNRVLAFTGALAFLAHLAGRKFVGPHDSYPNLYLVAIAESATGKDHPRKVIKEFARRQQMMGSIIDNAASGQGLEDALSRSPTLLCLMDEFDSVLREIKNDRPGSTSTEALSRILLSVFSESATGHTTRVRATGANKQHGGEQIDRPSLSMMATAIPSNFYGALSQRVLTGGLFARCLVFEAGKRSAFNENSGLAGRNPPFYLLRKIEKLASLQPTPSDKVALAPTIVNYTKEASAEIVNIAAEADRVLDEAQDDSERSVRGRAIELVGKLALLYAISVNVDKPEISLEAVRWAWRLVRALQDRMMQMARDYSAVDQRDERVLAAIRMIRKAGKKGVLRSAVTKNLHVMKDEMDKIEATLEDRGEVVVEHPRSANGRGTRYRMRETNKRGGAK